MHIERKPEDYRIHIQIDGVFPYFASQLIIDNFKRYAYQSDLFQRWISSWTDCIRSAVYYDACAAVVRSSDVADMGVQIYKQLRGFRSNLCTNPIIVELQSLKHINESHRGTVYITDAAVLLHRWLFLAYGMNINGSGVMKKINIREYHGKLAKPIIFAGEYTSYEVLRPMIAKWFQSLQEVQLELEKRKNNRLNGVSSSIRAKPMHWRQQEDLSCPTDFEVGDFDPSCPFRILENVPKTSIYYRRIQLLCQTFELDVTEAQNKYPSDWTSALVHRYEGFEVGMLTETLGIDIIHPKINEEFLMRKFSFFEIYYNSVRSSLDFMQRINLLPNNLGFVPLIADIQYSVSRNVTPLTTSESWIDRIHLEYDGFQSTF